MKSPISVIDPDRGVSGELARTFQARLGLKRRHAITFNSATRKVGYSKERRVDPQIVVGLLVDRAGFPLEIGCWEGNTAETTTMIPIIGQFQERHSLSDMVVVADAGMLSAAERAARSALHVPQGDRHAAEPVTECAT